MPIEIQGLASDAHPGSKITFGPFNNPVISYVIGINGFKLTYGKSDRTVEAMSINITGAGIQPGNYVTAQVQMVLQDSKGGHTIDVTDSVLKPICIAMTESSDPNTGMGNSYGIPSGSYEDVTLPNTPNSWSLTGGFLSGFNLAYKDAQRQVFQANALCGLSCNGQVGQISATATLQDSGRHSADIATVDAGYFVTADQAPPLGMQPVQAQNWGQTDVTMSQMTSISYAAFIMTHWAVQYPDGAPHNLQTLQVGASWWQPPGVNGNVVSIYNLCALMNDQNGDKQDDSVSYCQGYVIALP